MNNLPEIQVIDNALPQDKFNVLTDIVNKVRLPPPPLPNVNDPKIAECEF